MRNQLALLHPDKASARYLLSSCNEDHTASASFETLGANLAREVLAFIDQEGIATTLARLSFVGHSFGAVICRAALAHELLKPLWPKLHTYVSLSGPHLGMLYGSNTLVEIGIWGIRKWNKKARCLTELSLKDERLPAATFLYRLSKGESLRHFTNVLFVSSAEDRYVPHHSARVQLCPEAIHDPRQGSTFVSMVHNLMAPLHRCNMLHVDVSFGAGSGNTKPALAQQLDAAIGRAAHISFLEHRYFTEMFVHVYLSYLV
jgi:pimeloyl-ACP methyl ester carboxylesterase